MTADSLRDRIARALFLQEFPSSADAWDAPGESGRLRYRRRADAVLAVLADADPTDLGLEQVGWQLPEGGFHDDEWVPHFEHHLCTPVYARPRTEETPDA